MWNLPGLGFHLKQDGVPELRSPVGFGMTDSGSPSETTTRKGTNGVSTNGVTANLMFFDRGTFWVLPLTYFYIPKSARAYLFPQSVKIDYFCSGPISVDPVCPQPNDSSHTSIRPTEVCLWWQLSARQLSGAR